MSSATTPSWDKHPPIDVDDEEIRFESETEKVDDDEQSEVSLQYKDDFAILRAAEPHVAEMFHASVGKKRKGGKISVQSAVDLLLAPSFSKSLTDVSPENAVEHVNEQTDLKTDRFDSPSFAKPLFRSATTKNAENKSLLSPNYRNNETSFYGSKHDVFASSPRSINSDSSSCTSSKDDLFVSPQSPGPLLKQKNFVKNVRPGSAPLKRAGPTTTTTTPRSQRATVESALQKKKSASNHLSPMQPQQQQRASSLSPRRMRVSPTTSAAAPTTAKPRSSSLKRRPQQESQTSEKQFLKEKLLRLMDANQQQQSGGRLSQSETQSVSTKLTPIEVNSLVGNVSQHKKTPITTGGGGKLKMKIKSDSLKLKLEQETSSLPLPASRGDGTTVTTSTSGSSKPKSPSKQKRIIKIRKSDLEGSDEKKKANLDDLLDKAASEWKATLKRSSMASGTKWTPSSTTNSVSQVQSVTEKAERQRPSSRIRREKRTVVEKVVNVEPASNQGEETRDSSRNRSRRGSPRSYEMLDSDDGNASSDNVTGGPRTRSQSKSRRGSRPSPERRKSIFDDLKGLAGPMRKVEKSSRSTRTTDRRPSLMASVAKKFGSERRERSMSTPRADLSPEKDKAVLPRSLSNPRSQRVTRTINSDDDMKRGSISGPFSFQGLQKMLGFSPTSNKEKVIIIAEEKSTVADMHRATKLPMKSPGNDPSSMKKELLARIRKAGVTDEILRALSEQGLVIMERKARTPK